ncbi:hypothetical protein ACHAWF_002145, partial [Thalassiosira exigua]
MMKAASASLSSNDGARHDGPRRCIYNQADMEHFRRSPARKELLSFVSAMGTGLASSDASPHGGYDPRSPLANLAPALASLRGSLSCMSETWMDPNRGGIPPDSKAKARFGNPAFRTWHARLVERSYGIVRCLMECHVEHSSSGCGDADARGDDVAEARMLKDCAERGYRAASDEGPSLWRPNAEGNPSVPAESCSNQESIITELRAYLHDAFGHPIRIDYGTGHEASFIVFLLTCCKIGCFSWAGPNGGQGGDDKSQSQPSPRVVGAASLSLFNAYLDVTRGLQRDYMLEPAGSHGVWGLDDYHCVPFYLGACQMVAREEWQKQNRPSRKKHIVANEGTDQVSKGDSEDEAERRMPDTPYLPETTSPVTDRSALVSDPPDVHDHWTPSIIHNRPVMETHRPTYLYLSCIHFIRQIKPNVPFFESSPMLDDISHLGSWSKVSSGLLRLFEGEVLDKLQVVQHFVFGDVFEASWVPSRKAPPEAPRRTFVNGPMGEECIAPWAYSGEDGRGGG